MNESCLAIKTNRRTGTPARPCAALPQHSNAGVERYRTGKSAHPAIVRGHFTKRPSGFTLVELLVVMTIFLFLLSSVALSLGTLFRAQGNLQDELVEANAMSRLSEQFRADAHRATAAIVTNDDEAKTLQLTLPESTSVTYRLQSQQIVRTAYEGESVLHRDVFKLLEGTTSGCAVTASSPSFVTLTTSFVPPELTSEVAKPRVHKIEASIGLHAGGSR